MSRFLVDGGPARKAMVPRQRTGSGKFFLIGAATFESARAGARAHHGVRTRKAGLWFCVRCNNMRPGSRRWSGATY
jgi:hypothetical protein